MRPLLHLSRNSTEINAAVNHPAVRPHLGMPDVGNLDLSESVAKPENIFPIGEHGGFALIWTAPFAREVHTFISPEGRGAWARNAAREGIEMARECGTRLLWTRIPPEGPNVRVFAALMGMAPTGEVISTFGTPYAIYSMEVK